MTATRTEVNRTYDGRGNIIDEQTVEVDITGEVLRDRAGQALDVNRTYLANSSPTAADIRQQVDRLTRQNQALIRLVVGALDDVD